MLKDLVMASRSYRGYSQEEKLSYEELVELVDLTRFTPSSINIQPLKYYIVHKTEEVAAIQKLTKWAIALHDPNLPREGKCPTSFIVICADTKIHDMIPNFLKDAGIVAQTMLLAATEKGFGGCMIGSYPPSKVKETLKLADSMEPLLLVAFGKPDEKIVLVDIEEKDGDHHYYRDANDVHYVPKRRLKDILL